METETCSEIVEGFDNVDEQELTDEDAPQSLMVINKGFAERLLKLKFLAVQFQYEFAKMNTLGGAYHLCDHPKEALAIAIRQEKWGEFMGSQSLVLRARGFQAVNVALLGNYKVAIAMLNDLVRSANRNDLNDIESFLKALRIWLKNEKRRKGITK